MDVLFRVKALEWSQLVEGTWRAYGGPKGYIYIFRSRSAFSVDANCGWTAGPFGDLASAQAEVQAWFNEKMEEGLTPVIEADAKGGG